jgi:hypothetical protein
LLIGQEETNSGENTRNGLSSLEKQLMVGPLHANRVVEPLSGDFVIGLEYGVNIEDGMLRVAN